MVAHGDRAILLPGGALTGKRTLVAELVRAGCTRYSDDYAVLDAEGLVNCTSGPLCQEAFSSDRGTDTHRIPRGSVP